jgi:hypothetical protein
VHGLEEEVEMELLVRMARVGRGSDGKPFDYVTQCVAQRRYDAATIARIKRDIAVRKAAQSATQTKQDRDPPSR